MPAINETSIFHAGLVLFLEEDHYVTEDFLHVLNLANEERVAHHEDCDIICLGTYLKSLKSNRSNRSNRSSQIAQVSDAIGGGLSFRWDHGS